MSGAESGQSLETAPLTSSFKENIKAIFIPNLAA